MDDPPSPEALDELWTTHHHKWRDPAQINGLWEEAGKIDTRLLRYKIEGDFWGILDTTQQTILVAREYEHLMMALTVVEGEPYLSYMSMPHPSGIAYDPTRECVYVACTRNPNQILDLMPISGTVSRLDAAPPVVDDRPLTPVRSRFFPGSLYMHDLAMIDGELYANSVGQNAIIHLADDGGYQRVWWPHAIEHDGSPVFGQNHLQLNSIAAGENLATSFFSASADHLSARRPGHKNFPVDGRGVIFDGASREPIAYGLTRPHSARLYKGKLWVDNSGYGELGFIEDKKFISMSHLPGWTRGLAFAQTEAKTKAEAEVKDIAFVGTSRIIPHFSQYAPGLDVEKSQCGIHAVDLQSGELLASLIWPYGNQIFAIEFVPRHCTSGFPARVGRKRATARERTLFYTFDTSLNKGTKKNDS